jgi:hypothetical protein
MQKVLRRAIQNGGSASFKSEDWPTGGSKLRRFDDGLLTDAGRTVGRFGGRIKGTMTVDPKTGTWTVRGTIDLVKTGEFSYEPDATGNNPLGNAAIVGAGQLPNPANHFKQNKDGKPMPIYFNRALNFSAGGRYGGSPLR